MSDELADRVNDILTEVDEESRSILSSDDDEAEADLLETAAEAGDLLESTEPDDLLEAVGLDALPDGSEPESVPEAISEGDPERVDDLRRLLHLASLADRDDGNVLEGALGDLRDRLEAATTEAADEGGDGEESDAEETESEETESGESDAEGGLEERLQSVFGDSVSGVGDDLRQLSDRLGEAALGDDEDESANDGEDEDEEGDEDDGEDEEDDDGLLEGGLGDENGGGSGGGATRHSTVAPSPSKRADMRTPTRHSTMPDKDD